MDWSWLQKFSGGLDLIPICIAFIGIYSMRYLPPALRLETKFAYTLAGICFIALPIAQINWVVAVIREVPALGSLMDNVWTIYNFASLICMLLCLHTMEPRKRVGERDDQQV